MIILLTKRGLEFFVVGVESDWREEITKAKMKMIEIMQTMLF